MSLLSPLGTKLGHGRIDHQSQGRTRMAATYVDVNIRNPADPDSSWTEKFLVDTGAFDSLVPRARLEAIGLEHRGRRE